jgi:hypothetical protein
MRPPSKTNGRSRGACTSDTITELARDRRLQYAVEWHTFPAYRDALEAGAEALRVIPAVVPLPRAEDDEAAACGSLRWFRDIAEEDGLGFAFSRRLDDALVLMPSTGKSAALDKAATEAMVLWRTAESRDADVGLLGPLIEWDPLEPALCRGALPSLYRVS